MKNKLPCINCITLSVCRTTVKEHYGDSTFSLSLILKKCELLKNYIDEFCDIETRGTNREYWKSKKKAAPYVMVLLKYLKFNLEHFQEWQNIQ